MFRYFSECFVSVLPGLEYVYGGTPLLSLIRALGRTPLTADGIVLFTEFCNHSAKVAYSLYKERREWGDSAASNFMRARNVLYRAAKTDLPLFGREYFGCLLYRTAEDRDDHHIVHFRSETQHIGLHLFKKKRMYWSIPVLDDQPGYNGFERQHLAVVALSAFLQGHDFAARIGRASLNHVYAKTLRDHLDRLGFPLIRMRDMGLKETLALEEGLSFALGLKSFAPRVPNKDALAPVRRRRQKSAWPAPLEGRMSL